VLFCTARYTVQTLNRAVTTCRHHYGCASYGCRPAPLCQGWTTPSLHDLLEHAALAAVQVGFSLVDLRSRCFTSDPLVLALQLFLPSHLPVVEKKLLLCGVTYTSFFLLLFSAVFSFSFCVLSSCTFASAPWSPFVASGKSGFDGV
jgi:hypothetical protein